MTNLIKASALLVALGVLSGSIAAQSRGQSPQRGVASSKASNNKDGRSKTRGGDIQIVQTYFANTANLPPGLSKRDRLPPGLQKLLVRNGTLPPGLAKRQIAVPVSLERRLRLLPIGQSRLIIGNNLVVVHTGTSKIVDVFAIFPL